MSEQQFDAGVIGAFAAVGFVCLVVLIACMRKKPKPNIRVPRTTLWERTNRYHGGEQ